MSGSPRTLIRIVNERHGDWLQAAAEDRRRAPVAADAGDEGPGVTAVHRVSRPQHFLMSLRRMILASTGRA